MMDVLPNFLIVGASKSGTSSIYHYLKQHPDIFLSNKQKEGRYFSQMTGGYMGPGDKNVDNSIIRDKESYKTLFEGYNGEKAIGDISPEYLYFYKNAVPLIKQELSVNTRIIIILRSPIDRAFSAYTHFKRDDRELLSFEDALGKEAERAEKNWIWAWQYKNSGLYYDQVKAYVDVFPNVKIVLFEKFKQAPQKVLSEICTYLGVSGNYEFDTSYKYNVSGKPKNSVLYKLETSRGLIRFIKKIIPASLVSALKKSFTGENQMVKSEIEAETRKELIKFFNDDVMKLQNLIKTDLSQWFKV